MNLATLQALQHSHPNCTILVDHIHYRKNGYLVEYRSVNGHHKESRVVYYKLLSNNVYHPAWNNIID